jgi:peptidoglycan L-alanyl-D-glutamate endopeptidase CwlK
MPSFGTKSKAALDTIDPECQDVLNEAIKHCDFSIIWGFRGMDAQNTAFKKGRSRNRWPTSKHNTSPSIAFDIVPYPEGYAAPYEQFYAMASYVYAAASRLGVPLTWGGHWKNYTGNGPNDRDWAHFEKIQ